MCSKSMLSKYFLFFPFLLSLFCYHTSLGQTKTDTLAIQTAISNYYKGLEQKNARLARAAFDKQLIFLNGNHSDSPMQWQSHMYLHGRKINSWLEFMVNEASPHQNSIEFKHIYIRGNSALVVTTETGKNKFRSWNNEEVVWSLGSRKGSWRIASVFIKELSNP
jgi:hypothetical protein